MSQNEAFNKAMASAYANANTAQDQKDRIEKHAEYLRQCITGRHYDRVVVDDPYSRTGCAAPNQQYQQFVLTSEALRAAHDQETDTFKLKLPMSKMQRLATHNDWTIYISKGPGFVSGGMPVFGAFNSAGYTITSQEGKLVLDGVAFCYYGGQLFSGAITHTPSELEVADAKRIADAAKVQAHNDRIAKRMEKLRKRMK